ncbi:MAG: DsbA family protein [Armatimonadota bacterium]
MVAIGNLSSQIAENRILANQGPVAFKTRDYESRISDPAFVIFTDPLCVACRIAEKKVEAQPPNVRILFRWKLLPQHGDFALRIAAAIESTKTSELKKGNDFQKSVYTDPLPASDEDVILRAVKCGIDRQRIAELLKFPEPSSLQTIKSDGELATKLQISAVPTLAKASIYGDGGMPKILRLDLVSLSAFLNTSEGSQAGILKIFFPDNH